MERTSPRPTKSLCDGARVIGLEEAAGLLRKGIALGMISMPAESGFPKFVWNDVLEERAAPDLAARRKLEALLGKEPDESDAGVLERLLADAGRFGSSAMEELAAESGRLGRTRQPPTGDDIDEAAKHRGYGAARADAVRLIECPRFPQATNPAWKLGEAVARQLRLQEGLADNPLGDDTLASMSGTTSKALLAQPPSQAAVGISFLLHRGLTGDCIVLRSPFHQNRRFALARLLGDRLLSTREEALSPATDAFTYRQKMQRAFAAELLCPFDAVRAMLDGDYSPENRQFVANHFDVSEMTIRTQLANHRLIDRDELDDEPFELAA